VQSALEKLGAGPEDAFLVGDTPWDVKAAEQAGVPTYAVLTGGFSEQELRDAGAADVHESVSHLRGDLDEVMRTRTPATGNT
jgi:phosphoglycolate phosphatase-like HAD superfamily hydrolase